MQFASFSRDRSPQTPGSPWSSFLRQSPGLYTTGIRSSSLPPTPSELRSTLGHEENPFSESFGAAPSTASVTAFSPSTNFDVGSGDADHSHGRQHKKRSLSVSAVHDLDVHDAGDSSRGGKELKRDPLTVPSFSAERPATDPTQSVEPSINSGSGSDASKVYSATPETSVDNSPKPPMDLFNTSLVSSANDLSYSYYQPSHTNLDYPYSNQHHTTNHDSQTHDLTSFNLNSYQSFDLDNFVFQPYTPTIPLLPVTDPFDAFTIPRSSVSFTPDPKLEAQPKEESDYASTSEKAEPIATGPKKRGRKPRDPNAPVDQEKVAKQRLSALERNRIAASKSRQRKKEKLMSAETTVTDLCTTNGALQSTANVLRAELLALRKQIDLLHPDQSRCECHHIKGYLRREAEGGGIPTLDRLAGATLTRDYSRSGRFSSAQPASGLGSGSEGVGGGARSESGESGEPIPMVQQEVKIIEVEPVLLDGRVAIPLRRTKV